MSDSIVVFNQASRRLLVPTLPTLNTLARFAGYADWRDFQQSEDRPGDPETVTAAPLTEAAPTMAPPSLPERQRKPKRLVLELVGLAGTIALIAGLY